MRVPEGYTFHSVYRRDRGPELFDGSGRGDARFSPLESSGRVVPTLYGARTQTVALLETVFHDVHAAGVRQISESLHLARRGLIALTAPASLALVDLTDGGLTRLGLRREQLVATAPTHYACTRAWAAALHGRAVGRARPVGIAWESRVAELAQADSVLLHDLLPPGRTVFVLFGDALPTAPRVWLAGGAHLEDLTAGEGRLLAEEVAHQLGAVIVPN